MRVLQDQTNVTGEYRVQVTQRLTRNVEAQYLAVVEDLRPGGIVVFQEIYARESLAIATAWFIVDDLLLERQAGLEHATVPADTGGG